MKRQTWLKHCIPTNTRAPLAAYTCLILGQITRFSGIMWCGRSDLLTMAKVIVEKLRPLRWRKNGERAAAEPRRRATASPTLLGDDCGTRDRGIPSRPR